MAGKLSYVGAGLALDAALGRVDTTARSVYLALLTVAPDQATTMATMTEATFTYTRPAVTFDAPGGTPRLCANSGDITIGPLSDADGSETVSHWALVSAATGTTGDLLAYGDWTTPRTPDADATLTLAAGDLDIVVD